MNEEENTPLTFLVPIALKERIEARAKKLGFPNTSNYLRYLVIKDIEAGA